MAKVEQSYIFKCLPESLVVIHLVADLLEVYVHLDTAIFLEIVVIFELLRT